MFFVFGAATLIWLLPWQQVVRRLPKTGHFDAGAPVSLRALLGKWPLWSMSIVHALGNYCFYFILTWMPLYLTKSRGFTITEMTLLASLGFAVQAACALGYGQFSDWWTRSGARGHVSSLDDGRQPAAGGSCDPRPGIRAHRASDRFSAVRCGGRVRFAVTQPLCDRADVRGPRASGTWVGFQNALGNLSGIFGPVVTGIIVDHAGYGSAFILTAAVAVTGALWWAVCVPSIRQVALD